MRALWCRDGLRRYRLPGVARPDGEDNGGNQYQDNDGSVVAHGSSFRWAILARLLTA
jgi:hypothetical protein